MPTTPRDLGKGARDGLIRHAPGLAGVIAAGARRGIVPPSVWRRIHPIGIWSLHAPDGTAFRYDATFGHDRLARHIVWTDLRHWETTTQPVVCHLAGQVEVFVDVGAYSGIYTLLACTANPALRAVAFEPNPVKLPQLRSNMALNGLCDRVTIVGKALSCTSGPARLAVASDDSQSSLGAAGRAVNEIVEVQVTTGDEALADMPVGLVKIDVEGFEPDVLVGMAGTLAAHRPKIIAECLGQEALDRLRETAARFGYGYVYHLDRPGPVRAGAGFRHPYRFPNYLFSTEPVTEW